MWYEKWGQVIPTGTLARSFGEEGAKDILRHPYVISAQLPLLDISPRSARLISQTELIGAKIHEIESVLKLVET